MESIPNRLSQDYQRCKTRHAFDQAESVKHRLGGLSGIFRLRSYWY